MNDPDRITIVPTCVPQSRDDLADKIKQVSRFSNMLHIDIDDGILAPSISWPYVGQGMLGELEGGLDIPVDNFLMQIHLMVSDCREVGEFFARAGAYSIIVHIEAMDGMTDTAREMFEKWRRLGVREIGLAVLLDTPIEKLNSLLPSCDFIQVLSVATIGAQGAPFDGRAVGRLEQLRELHSDFPLAVDGGVSAANIASLMAAGASRFSVGASIMHAEDPAQAYAHLRAVALSS